MLKKQFKIIGKLGSGTFSTVYKVKRKSDDKYYALKKVKMSKLSKKEKANALNEIRILASVDNPYIVSYKEAFYDDASSSLCIIMDFAGGGDLLQKIRLFQKERLKFSEKMSWKYIIQMIKGLKALHETNVLHRDLKCANVFLSADQKTIKIGDMNVSKISSSLVKTQTGTPYYASPEVWKDKPYGAKSDIWSLGCVIYEMLAKFPPFRANCMKGLYQKIVKGKFKRIPYKYSNDLQQLIKMMLQRNPKKRPTCTKLLAHPILQEHMDVMDQSVDQVSEDSWGKEKKINLLNTIKLPRDLKVIQIPISFILSFIKKLSKILPAPNYKSVSEKEKEKENSKPEKSKPSTIETEFIGGEKLNTEEREKKEEKKKKERVKKEYKKIYIIKQNKQKNVHKRAVSSDPNSSARAMKKVEILKSQRKRQYSKSPYQRKPSAYFPKIYQRKPQSCREELERNKLRKARSQEYLKEIITRQKQYSRRAASRRKQRNKISNSINSRGRLIKQSQQAQLFKGCYNQPSPRLPKPYKKQILSRQIGGGNLLPPRNRQGMVIKVKHINSKRSRAKKDQYYFANRGRNILNNVHSSLHSKHSKYISKIDSYMNQQQHHDIFQLKEYAKKNYINKQQYAKLRGIR